MSSQADHRDKNAASFHELAAAKRSSFLGELWAFGMNNKKWWMLPLIIFVFLLGLLVILGGGPAAPFIYTLF